MSQGPDLAERRQAAVRLTTEIVAAYIGHNRVAVEAIPALIFQVHAALLQPSDSAPASSVKAKPNLAQIRKSITPDALISFEDGQPYKQLKRHLTAHGMTPAEYRAKWGLPENYPMVAATFSAKRSEFAKAMGLGAKGRVAPVAEAPATPPRQRIKGRLGLFGRKS